MIRASIGRIIKLGGNNATESTAGVGGWRVPGDLQNPLGTFFLFDFLGNKPGKVDGCIQSFFAFVLNDNSLCREQPPEIHSIP